MKCTYLNWLNRKDNAVQNAQYAIDNNNSVMADYWKNQAKFCEKQLNALINATAEKWIEKEYGSVK